MQKQTSTGFRSAFGVAIVSLSFAFGAISGEKLPGQIHDYPSKDAAAATKPHQLRFEFPNDQVARDEFRSEEFYAIILKSADKCTLTEEEREQIQEQFPQNKVFMDLFGCDEYIEESITYTNTNADYAFIAVFGGLSFDQARQLFEQYDLASKFPGANIRKMQAVLVYS